MYLHGSGRGITCWGFPIINVVAVLAYAVINPLELVL